MMIALWASAHALQPPDPLALCEEQASFFAAEVRERPERPVLTWWLGAEPCPERTWLDGAPPPDGTEVRCIDRRGRWWGPETLFAPTGEVVRESSWRNDRELGPRYDWDCRGRAVIRRSEMRRGVLHGEVVEWLTDGGVMVSTWRAGVKWGPAWKLDARGEVVWVERWEDGERFGRACVWRAGEWQHTVYSASTSRLANG